jgi:hypothetical protein
MRKPAIYLLASAVALSLSLVACGPITSLISSRESPTATSVSPRESPTAVSVYSWQSTISAMDSLQSAEVPDHLLVEDAVKTGDEFDVNDYFTVLTHLSMEPGYVLDYVYCYDDSFAGGPAVYARPVDTPPYRTCSEYEQSAQDTYLNHVQIDGTEEGFFEFVLLDIKGEQFYLWWHAGYGDTTMIVDRTSLESALSETESFCGELPETMGPEAQRLTLDPMIENRVLFMSVKFIAFSKFGGFMQASYSIRKNFPHEIHSRSTEVLIPYRCPVVF